MRKWAVFALFSLPAFGQSAFYQFPESLPGATFRVCPVGTSNPCPTPANIYADSGLTQLIPQPAQTGVTGQFGFYVAPGQYTIQISAPYNLVYIVNVGTGGGGGVIPPGITNQQLVYTASNAVGGQTKAIYDVRDWMTCDGNGTTGTDASAGMNSLLSTIGTNDATIRFVGSTISSATCRIGNMFFRQNITLDFSGGGAIQFISSSTPPGGAGFVNGTSVECGAGTTCSAPALSVTGGNTIVVTEAPYPGFSPNKTTQVTDNCGNFYIHVFQSLANQTRNQGMWVASSASAGSCTVTATANASLTTHMMIVSQWSGLGPVASLDNSASTNATGTTMSSGAATMAAGSLLIAFGGQPFTFPETCTAGAGYTQPAGIVGQTSPNGSMCLEYQLSAAGGSTSATQTISTNPSPGLWVYSLVGLKPGNATATIWGGIINPDQHQIFYNADSATGHGVVDFTGSSITQDVYPEWWGASTNATAAVNTPAIRASIWAAYGGGLTQARTNASGLSIYNRPLRIGGLYQINDELKMYDVLGFKMIGVNRLSSGFIQTASNKRIIDGQSVAYGYFSDLSFSGTASSTLPLVDLDYNGVSTPGDLRPQFIDFDRVNFGGAGVVAQGVLIAKSGGGAQGSNIYCRDCASQSFTTAAWQIGTATALANNALDIGYSGDIQGCPLAGILNYGGGYISFGDGVEEASMENGFGTQTGFDMICVTSQGPCSMDYMRSESRRLISGNDIVLHKSRMINNPSFLIPGGTFPVGSIMSGSTVGGDGAYYTVTNNGGPASGAGTLVAPLRASSGTATTLSDTNQNVNGSVTVKAFVGAETVTQAVTGSTGTIITVPSSIGTVTGTNTAGQFVVAETATQAVTGITAVVQSPTPNLSNPTLPLLMNNFSGTADSTHVWTGGTSGATYAPSAAPTFSASTMLITAATGSPDNSHNWTGGTSGAVFVPTTAPTNEAAFTVNAFVGQFASVLSGKNAGCYGVITANTATSVTFSAGWVTRYAKLGCTVLPDTGSTYVVEPGWNHGTVASGGMTMVYLNENAIDCETTVGVGGGCSADGRMEDVIVAGGQLKVAFSMVLDNVQVYRQDWFNNSGGGTPQQCCEMVNNWDVRVVPTISPSTIPYQGLFYQNWTLPVIGGATSYNGANQRRLGTKALVWDIGNIGTSNPPANTSAASVWIGGRSDSGAGSDATRNILEFGGMLGRGVPLPSVANSFNTTDQNGTDTDITGGPSTGAGLGGAINFWTSNPGGSSATPNSGLKRWRINAAGNLEATQGKGQHILTQAANNDIFGTASGTTTTATVTFTTNYTSTPVCVITPTTAGVTSAIITSQSNSGFTITYAPNAATNFNYHCGGNPN
jgi:hypothetical protein